MDKVPSAWCSFIWAAFCMETRTTRRSCFLKRVLEWMPAGHGFSCSASASSLGRSNWAILSTMVPSCMKVVISRSFRLWEEVYAYRGHGCDGTGWDRDAILVFRPVE